MGGAFCWGEQPAIFRVRAEEVVVSFTESHLTVFFRAVSVVGSYAAFNDAVAVNLMRRAGGICVRGTEQLGAASTVLFTRGYT